MKDKEIKIMLIKDITQYLESGKAYSKELKNWKLVRNLKEYILKE